MRPARCRAPPASTRSISASDTHSKPMPAAAHRAQDVRMRIRLQRVQRAAIGLEAARSLARPRRPARGRRRRRSRAAPSAPNKAVALLPPTRAARARGDRRACANSCSHVGPEHAIARQRADQQLVQLLDQPVALVLVDHEREVEVVRGLADEIDLLLLEQRERVAELVQDGADVAPDQRHARRRAR